MSAVETENRLQAIGAFPVGSLGPPPDGVATPAPVGRGITSFTRNAIGDYTVITDADLSPVQNVFQSFCSGGKMSVVQAGSREIDILLFDRGGGGPPAAADLDFFLHVYQVPTAPL